MRGSSATRGSKWLHPGEALISLSLSCQGRKGLSRYLHKGVGRDEGADFGCLQVPTRLPMERSGSAVGVDRSGDSGKLWPLPDDREEGMSLSRRFQLLHRMRVQIIGPSRAQSRTLIVRQAKFSCLLNNALHAPQQTHVHLVGSLSTYTHSLHDIRLTSAIPNPSSRTQCWGWGCPVAFMYALGSYHLPRGSFILRFLPRWYADTGTRSRDQRETVASFIRRHEDALMLG
jgi:hypothetical protein